MGNLAKDSFIDTAGVSLDSHTPDTGPIWQFSDLSDSFRISDSEVAAYCELVGTGVAFVDVSPVNYTVSVTIDTANFSVLGQQAGVVARWQTAPQQGYKAVVNYDGTNFQAKLYKSQISDVPPDTQLGSTSANLSTGSGILSFQVNGTAIGPIKWKGVQVVAKVTDSTYTTGDPGIHASFLTLSSVDFFDNFLVVGTGTIVAPKPKRVKIRVFEHPRIRAHKNILYAMKWVPRNTPAVAQNTSRFFHLFP